jgi:hypothetical protein
LLGRLTVQGKIEAHQKQTLDTKLLNIIALSAKLFTWRSLFHLGYNDATNAFIIARRYLWYLLLTLVDQIFRIADSLRPLSPTAIVDLPVGFREAGLS